MFQKTVLPRRPASFDVLCAGEPVWRSAGVPGDRVPRAPRAGIFEIATRLARSELRVGVATVLEDDRRGRALRAEMAGANVDVSAVLRSA